MAKDLRINFLVSDSRSGSTLVARTLHETLDGVVVTPEISLREAIRVYEHDPLNIDGLTKALENGRFFSSLEMETSDFRAAYANEFAHDLPMTVRFFLAQSFANQKPSHVFLKKGHHVFDAEKLVKLFPESKFICLYRDPRSIYESKRRTERPYRPGETMAWAGLLGTVLRGRQYTRAMIELEKKGTGIRLRFEDLIANRNAALKVVQDKLNLDSIPAGQEKEYKIAEIEKGIHAGAISGAADHSKIEAWVTELSKSEKSAIDLLTKNDRRALGYKDAGDAIQIYGLSKIALELPKLLVRLVKRALSRAAAG